MDGPGRRKEGPSRMEAVAGLGGLRTRSKGSGKSCSGIWKEGSRRNGKGVERSGKPSLDERESLSGTGMTTCLLGGHGWGE